MVDIDTDLLTSAALVKCWGLSKLQNGRSLEDSLTIEGISLWSAVSPMLSNRCVSGLLSNKATIRKKLVYAFANKPRLAIFDWKTQSNSNATSCECWPTATAFLCLGFSNYMYRETIEPVARRLASASDASVIVLNDQFNLKEDGLPSDIVSQTVWNHWCPTITSDIRRMRKALQDARTYLTKSSSLESILQDSGHQISRFQHIFTWLFDFYLPRLITYVAIAKHIATWHHPSLIISPDVNDPRTRIFCLAGKLVDIKTLEVQFSFYGPASVEWRFFIADHLAVTGKTNFDHMLQHGISSGIMTITGSPRYDESILTSLFSDSSNTQAEVVNGGKHILFASQPYYPEAFKSEIVRRRMIEDLFDAAQEVDDVVVVVKPHPFDNVAELKSLANGRNCILFADRHKDIRDLLKTAQAFVTFFSTATFDALVLAIPTINISYLNGYWNDTFENSGATMVAKSKTELVSILRDISTGAISERQRKLDSNRESFLTTWFYALDGCAAERIESLALRMVSQIRSLS